MDMDNLIALERRDCVSDIMLKDLSSPQLQTLVSVMQPEEPSSPTKLHIVLMWDGESPPPRFVLGWINPTSSFPGLPNLLIRDGHQPLCVQTPVPVTMNPVPI
jgi:hypothetical protein